jgi:hypothetical protein
MVLGSRERLLLPVYRPPGRGEDDLAHAVSRTVLEKTYRAQYVHLRVEIWLSDGTPHVHLGRLMAQSLWGKLLEDMGASIADVRLVELRSIGDVPALASREVVHYGDLMTPLEHVPSHVRADEPGTPGKQDPHRLVGAS